MLNDLPQTLKLFADGRTMIKCCSTDYSTTEKKSATDAEKLHV